MKKNIDNSVRLLPLLPMALFRQSGISEYVGDVPPDGSDLSDGGLCTAMIGMFFSKEDPDLSHMDMAYPGSSPRHLFGRFVSGNELSAESVRGRLEAMGDKDLDRIYLRAYELFCRNLSIYSDSYCLGIDSVLIDRGEAGLRSVTVAELTDCNNIMCDCRVYKGSETIRCMMEDLQRIADPEETKIYCRSTVLSKADLEEINDAGFLFAARCPDENYTDELRFTDGIGKGMEPTVSTVSWDFYERFDSSDRRRMLACCATSRKERVRLTTSVINNETRLLFRMDERRRYADGPLRDYIRRVHPSMSDPLNVDYSKTGCPIVLVGNIRPYEYNHGLTPLGLLTKYYAHCSKRHALARVRHTRILAEGLDDSPATDRSIVFAHSLAMLLADVMEHRFRTCMISKRMNGLISDYDRMTAEYNDDTHSAEIYGDRKLFSSFSKYFTALGISMDRMFMR